MGAVLVEWSSAEAGWLQVWSVPCLQLRRVQMLRLQIQGEPQYASCDLGVR